MFNEQCSAITSCILPSTNLVSLFTALIGVSSRRPELNGSSAFLCSLVSLCFSRSQILALVTLCDTYKKLYLSFPSTLKSHFHNARLLATRREIFVYPELFPFCASSPPTSIN
jgi:hypothetical protein